MSRLPVADGPFFAPRGRLAAYSLRVSLLQQCNFSCPYCLPGAVAPYTPKADWLRADDYARLAPLFAARGITKVRFTGGEPLLRDDCAGVVAAFHAAMPGADLALTTNGSRLAGAMGALRAAGLRRLTVHLDTLRADRYPQLMGPGDLGAVLAALGDARGTFDEVKLNTVVQRGVNDDEVLDFLDLSARLGVQVRFIELMNTGSADGYVHDVFKAGAEIVRDVSRQRRVEPIGRAEMSDPATLFRVVDTGVVFGLIASDTQPFCAACDRLRLTADGRLRGCLYQAGGVPLGSLLRSGADDAQLAALIDVGLDDKRSYHPLSAPGRVPFSMADVGG